MIKLYESLPDEIVEKTKLFIQRQVTRPIIESVILHPQYDEESGNLLAAPNFGIEFTRQSMAQLEMKSWDDVLRSRNIYFEFLPVMEAAYSHTNPVAIKAKVKLLGFPVGEPRAPLPALTAKQLQPLEEVIKRFELKERYGLV